MSKTFYLVGRADPRITAEWLGTSLWISSSRPDESGRWSIVDAKRATTLFVFQPSVVERWPSALCAGGSLFEERRHFCRHGLRLPGRDADSCSSLENLRPLKSYGHRMRSRFRTSSLVLLVLASSLLIASCSSPQTKNSVSKNFATPLSATNAWFKTINEKQPSTMLAHAAPSARDMMDWNGGITSEWPSFTAVNCKIEKSTDITSNLLCTFNEKASPGNQIDAFWTVSLEEAPPASG